MRKLYVALFLAVSLSSCSNKEPAISDLKKEHAIEVSLETKQLNSTSVLLISRQNVYVKGVLVKTIFRTDTIPALGDSLQMVNSEDSNRLMRIPQEYEFFVTVK